MKHLTALSQLSLSTLLLVAIGAAACGDIDDAATSGSKAGDRLEFEALLSPGAGVRTRAATPEYIESSPFDMDFYIQLCAWRDAESVEAVGTEPKETAVGTYVVPSGYKGQLAPKEEDANEPLMWTDLKKPHTFYAWNIPWDEAYLQKHEKDYSAKYTENGTYDPKEDGIPEEGIKIKFYNSSEADGYGTYRNNAVYENFIGAKSSAPYSYKEHGKYVNLTFHHLVSKIRIGSFMLIESDGSIKKDLQADVTFVGMATEATFYPHPADHGRPRVEPASDNPDNGVTFYIDNDAGTDDVFYVCPELDFSQIDFKVKINDERFADYNTYYGTFDDVVFYREPGSDYDAETDEEGNIRDSKILHAGEMMTLNIVLIPGVGPGLRLIITDWSDEEPQSAQYHTYPGIYSDAEVKEIHDFFTNQKDYNSDNNPEIERFFEMYGQERDIDGDGKDEKVFPLYENVDISNGNNANIFPIPDGYILDGMGHTITMKSNSGSVFGHKYFNIGPVRDVWITDGTDTIYIDRDGYVWVYDATANDYVKTENCLTELERTGDQRTDKKSYDISCITGQVHQSSYYNNSITGTGN